MKLKRKVAAVTGGSRDIGRLVCIKLAKEGAKIALNYFNSKADKDLAIAAIKNFGGYAVLIYG